MIKKNNWKKKLQYIILTRGDLIDEQESNSASSSSERLKEESACNISCKHIGGIQSQKAFANKVIKPIKW